MLIYNSTNNKACTVKNNRDDKRKKRERRKLARIIFSVAGATPTWIYIYMETFLLLILGSRYLIYDTSGIPLFLLLSHT